MALSVKIYNVMFRYQIYILVSLLFTPTFSLASTIDSTRSINMTVAVLSTQLNTIQQNLLLNNECPEMEEPQQHWNRISLEFFILCKALKLGGLNPSFSFIQYPNHRRLSIEALKGRFTMPLVSLWKHEADPEVFLKTSTFLSAKQTELGVYMRADETALVNIQNIQDLKKYRAVTHFAWQLDIAVLKEMGIRYVTTSSYENMFKMLEAKRADFLLTSFTASENMQQKLGDITLVPVSGVKVILNSSRSFVVNKDAPNALLVYEALENGLQLLRSKGLIDKYFQETGFMNKRVEKWKVLCCKELLKL